MVREALTRAADLYQQSGNTARSVAMLERLVRDYPTPVRRRDRSAPAAAGIAASSGDVERQRYWQHEIVKADAAAGAARTDRTRYLASRAQLALAAPARDAVPQHQAGRAAQAEPAGEEEGARCGGAGLQGGRRLPGRGDHHRCHLRDRGALSHAGARSDDLRATEEALRPMRSSSTTRCSTSSPFRSRSRRSRSTRSTPSAHRTGSTTSRCATASTHWPNSSRRVMVRASSVRAGSRRWSPPARRGGQR